MLSRMARRSGQQWRIAISMFVALALLSPLSPGVTPARAATADQKDVATGSNADLSGFDWSRYGVIFAGSLSQQSFDSAAQVPIGQTHLFLSWNAIEPTDTSTKSFAYSRYDAVLARNATSGAKAVGVITDCPLWACVDLHGPIKPDYMPAFIEFMTAMVQRYSHAPFNVHNWEIFNEPDSSTINDHSIGWGADPVRYAQLMSTITPLIKSLDPEAIVSIGGLAYDWFYEAVPPGPFNRNFLADYLAAGGGEYTDYIGFHHYPFNVNWPNDMPAKIAEIKGILARYNYTKPLVCTETSAPSSGTFGFTEETQARYLVVNMTYAIAAGLPGLTWFSIADWPDPGSLFAQSGLLRIDGSRKPAYVAYQTYYNEIGESAYLGASSRIGINNELIEGGVFAGSDPSRPVAVLWSTVNFQTEAVLPGASYIRALNMVGDPVEPTYNPNGDVVLSIGPNPIFVELNNLNAIPSDCAISFSDVHSSDYFYEPVRYMYCRGIISGYGDNTFRPFFNATRGQLSKIITLSEGWPIDTTGGPHFIDVSTTSTFYSFIETAYNRGVISGYDGPFGREFRWGNNITRGQLAKIIVNARGWATDTTGGPHFIDVTPSNPFYDAIETAYNRGIIAGYDGPFGREFRWGANATRGQISKIVYNALNSPAVSVASAAAQSKMDTQTYLQSYLNRYNNEK